VNIGLFGGTFDPPHAGHLIVAQDAALALGLDRILFVPAAQPPHKQMAAVSETAVRAKMLRLAIQDDPRFDLEPVELERTGPSYTVETLRALRDREPSTNWTLFMGADQYAEFETWREPAAIRRLARIAVLTRLGSGAGGVSGTVPVATPLGEGAVEVQVTRIDISSTMIRDRVAAGRPIRYLVPPAVEAFIFEHGLYGRNGRAAAG
jgi:nicotinate-nucleotide adenylyltransferase